MSGISTHVLDTALGRPAVGLSVILEQQRERAFVLLGQSITDTQGRIADFLGSTPLEAATYRLRFATGPYLLAMHGAAFYPLVEVSFEVLEPAAHYHVPLLLSPYGYSTYRGS